MSGIVLRAYSPMGYYPSNAIRDKDASLVIADDLIYSVARYKPVIIENDYYFADYEWLKPEEVRLLSAIALSVPEDCGKVYFYPHTIGYTIQDPDYDLSDTEILEDLKRHLLFRITNWKDYNPSDFLHNNTNACPDSEAMECTEASEIPQCLEDNNTASVTFQETYSWSIFNPPSPPILGGPRYRNHDFILDLSRQKELFDAINIDDHLLIRGLGALLKGDVLHSHQIFHTEACISLHIAMEATLQLVLRKLKETIPNPSNKDASKHIGEVFGSDYPEHYFEDYYEDRIKAIHPANRFGIYPDAPLEADDFYDLYEPLRAVFDFLITGHVRAN